jgi:hypothetical protein
MISSAINCPINCGLASSSFTRSFSKKSGLGSYKLITNPIKRVLSFASENIININDRVTKRNISSSWVTDYIINVQPLIDGWFQNVTLTSLNPNILSQSFVYQSDGDCLVRADASDGEIVLTRLLTTSDSSSTVDTFQSWNTSSLSYHCESQVNNLILNKTQLNLFTIANGNSFIRNANCWAHNVDLSCASPWNSTAGPLMAGTLVSPKHVIFCKHAGFYPSLGSTIFFVDINNNIITRTISNLSPISICDVVVGTLNSDVPSNIKFSKILPDNFNVYFPSLQNLSSQIWYVPAIYLNQSDLAGIMGLRLLKDGGILGLELINNIQSALYKPNISTYINYSIPIVTGDSGNPMFLIINNEPVLLGVFTGPSSGAHVSYSTIKSAINNIMSSSGYQLTEINLSSFNTY